MYNNLFNVNDSEVKRILEMHKNATRNQYLIVEESPKPNTLAVDYGNLFPQGKYLVKGEIADKICLILKNAELKLVLLLNSIFISINPDMSSISFINLNIIVGNFLLLT